LILKITKFLKPELIFSGAVHLPRSLVYVLFALGIAIVPASAQTGTPDDVQRFIVQDPLQAAAQLLDRGLVQQAAMIMAALEQLPHEKRANLDATEYEFLRGRVAFAEARYADAIAAFTGILYRRPNLTRVRLELARTYFAAHDLNRSEEQFELVLGSKLPGEASDNILGFLSEIEDQRLWRINFNIAIAPDTNINTATDSETVDIFGLPFSLSDEARASSGVGVQVQAGYEYRPYIIGQSRLNLATNIQRTEYNGANFDDTIISTHFGSRLRFGKTHYDLNWAAFRRWFGTRGFNSGIGGNMDITHRLSPRLLGRLSVVSQVVNYDQNPGQNGTVASVELGASYWLSTTGTIRGSFGVNYDFAVEDAFENTAYRIDGAYTHQAPIALTLTFGASAVLRQFDGINPTFLKRRSDQLYALRFHVVKRDIRIFGLSPYVSYSFTRSSSNIALFEYSRHRAQFGFMRLF
jgi:outer membrane protein